MYIKFKHKIPKSAFSFSNRIQKLIYQFVLKHIRLINKIKS